MTGLLLVLALVVAPAPPKITTLYDDEVKVGAGRIRTLDIPLPEKPARIVCTFEVVEGGSGVRLVLLRREDAARWLRGEAHEALAGTTYSKRGAMTYRPVEPDHYQLVLDNRMEGRGTASVRLLVRVVDVEEGGGPVRTADPAKGQVLVLGSLGLFVLVAGVFAVRLRQGLRRH